MMTDELLQDGKPLKSSERTDEELNDYELGCEAALDGKPNDDTKRLAWQRGSTDARESLLRL